MKLSNFVIRCLKDVNPDIIKIELEEDKEYLQDEIQELLFCLKRNGCETSQAYGELSKLLPGHWLRAREIFGNNVIYTESEAGSVLLTDEANTCRIFINNGMGDGLVRVGIFEDGTKEAEWIDHMLNISNVALKGEFCIWNNDYSADTIVARLSGNYQVYTYDGLVAFVHWND